MEAYHRDRPLPDRAKSQPDRAKKQPKSLFTPTPLPVFDCILLAKLHVKH
jgi:hypothetical protein